MANQREAPPRLLSFYRRLILACGLIYLAFADTPIILLSAAADAEKVARQWACPLVRKPFSLDRLSDALTRVIGGK